MTVLVDDVVVSIGMRDRSRWISIRVGNGHVTHPSCYFICMFIPIRG